MCSTVGPAQRSFRSIMRGCSKKNLEQRVKPQELSAGELLNNTSHANYGGRHLLAVERLGPHRWRADRVVFAQEKQTAVNEPT